MKRWLGLIVLMTIFLSHSQVSSWVGCTIEVKDTWPDGKGEFDLQILHMEHLRCFFGKDTRDKIYGMIGLRACLLIRVIVKQDAYFYPYELQFVQGKNQYAVDYEDIVKISDVLCDTKLRNGVEVFGVIFIPEGINVDLPFRIYYEDFQATFFIPENIEIEREDCP